MPTLASMPQTTATLSAAVVAFAWGDWTRARARSRPRSRR